MKDMLAGVWGRCGFLLKERGGFETSRARRRLRAAAETRFCVFSLQAGSEWHG